MSCAVGYIAYQLVAVAFLSSKQAICRSDQGLYQVNVFPFIAPSDVVSLPHSAFMEYQINGIRVILNIKPVSDVLATAVDR